MIKEDHAVPHAIQAALDKLNDLTKTMRRAEGFPALLSALSQGRSATIDGAWGSSGALAAAALALYTPHTLLVVLAHPRDLDGWAGDLQSCAGIRPAPSGQK